MDYISIIYNHIVANTSITGTSGKNDLTLPLDTPRTFQICPYNLFYMEDIGNNSTSALSYTIRGLKEDTTYKLNITIECENGTNTIWLSAMTAAGMGEQSLIL